MNKLKRAAIKLKQPIKSGLVTILIILGAMITFGSVSFVIGYPLVFFGFDFTRDDIGFYQKCLGMGMISLVIMVTLAGFIFKLYEVFNKVKKFWDEA